MSTEVTIVSNTELNADNIVRKFGHNPVVLVSEGNQDIVYSGEAYFPSDVVSGSNINVVGGVDDTVSGGFEMELK